MMNLLVTAHTGCNDSPQNTIASVLLGDELGADLNEVDVRSTSNEVPILWHDETLVSQTGESYMIEDMTYSEILDLEKHDGIVFSHPKARITTLKEVFDAIEDRDIHLNLDLKDDKCIEPVTKLVRKCGFTDRVVFSGCEENRASYLKGSNAEFQVLLNVNEQLFDQKSIAYSDTIRVICDSAISAGCCGLNIRYDLCTPELVEYASYRFLPVAVWTLRPEDMFVKYIEMGVASITTRHVKELFELVGTRLAI